MAIAPVIAEAVAEHLGEFTPENGWYDPADIQCQGAAFHSPTPLTMVDTWITPESLSSASDAEDLIVQLCPTCAGNLDVLKALLLATNGELPWVVRRAFGNKVRALAQRGWARYQVETSG